MTDDLQKSGAVSSNGVEVLAKCEACGQLYDRAEPSQVRYHEHPGHKPRQRHNLAYLMEQGK